MILMKDIIQEGNPILRKRASDVVFPLAREDFDSLKLMMEYILNSQNELLVETLAIRPSVGLAAPQIGISKKMFCMSAFDETGETLHSYAIVNPKIISYSEELTYLPGGEGCLSVDEEKNGLVPRANKIKAKAFLVNLKTMEVKETLLKLSGYVSIVFQHEFDHLKGVLFVDKVKETIPNTKPVVFIDEPIETE